MSGRVRSRLVSFISKNPRLFSSKRNKEPIPVTGQPPPPPHSIIPQPPPPAPHATSPSPPTTAVYASHGPGKRDMATEENLEFDFEEKDLASEESLWDLYERWMSHYKVYRDLNEKKKRFDTFKGNAKAVLEVNKSGLSYTAALYKFADLTNVEFRRQYCEFRSNLHTDDYELGHDLRGCQGAPIPVTGQPPPPPHSIIPQPPPPVPHATSPSPPTTAVYASHGERDMATEGNSNFDYDEKDLASEESLWNLYERWMRHWKVSRTLDEKQKHFKAFKRNAKHVLKENNKQIKLGNSMRLGLNMFADLTEKEFLRSYTGLRADC